MDEQTTNAGDGGYRSRVRFAKGLSPAFGPLDAYWAARYDFRVRARWWRMMFAEPAWCMARKDRGWPVPERNLAIISAYNPYSQKLTDTQNCERQRALQERLRSAGAEFDESLGSARDGSWPEPGCAIVNIERDELLALAREYEQAATVLVVSGCTGLLVTHTGQWFPRSSRVLASTGPSAVHTKKD
jgi:hypothetical protein